MFIIYTFKSEDFPALGLPDSAKILEMAITFNRQRRARDVAFNLPDISLETGKSLVKLIQKRDAQEPIRYAPKPEWLTRRSRRKFTLHKGI